jgi:arylsulfatase A-like enzyme
VFGRAFSSCPICSPYRGHILTGRYSHTNGVVDNEYRLFPTVKTLPQILKEAGYHTGFIGKWHLGYGPYTEEKRCGFDYMAANNCRHNYYSISYYENERGPIPIEGFGPDGETALAIRFLEDHSRNRAASPFCLFLGWGPPHWPYDQFPGEFKKYDPEGVDLPPNVPRQMEAFARQEIALYYGNVSALDYQMGRIIRTLDELDLAENTILCFSSDHGDHLSSHGYGKPGDRWLHSSMRASKATPYEESIHIPLIIRHPSTLRGGTRSDVFFSSVDVMPTLLGLCGLATPGDVQGIDLTGPISGRGGSGPDSVYLQILGEGWPHRGPWVGLWRGIRTDRWLYARWKVGDHEPVLFDVQNDPFELANLANKREHAEVRRRLEGRLRRWIYETGDPFDAGERDPKTGMLLLGQEFTHEKWNR